MTREVAFGTLRYPFAALRDHKGSDCCRIRLRIVRCGGRHTYPADEDILGQRGVGIFNLDKGKLYLPIGEVINEINQFAGYPIGTMSAGSDSTLASPIGIQAYLQCSAP